MKRVAVIDYGMGNLHSVAKAVAQAGERLRVQVTAEEKAILAADRVIFPGVGAMRDCMAEIKRLGIDSMLARLAGDRPILAICVGLQALLEFSEENDGVECIGLLPGRVKRFAEALLDADGNRLKVPHIGWNRVRQAREHPLWKGIADNSYFYFVHSYYAQPAERDTVAGETDYPASFASALARGAIFAVQFHPEKSQRDGLRLLSNFLDWDGSD